MALNLTHIENNVFSVGSFDAKTYFSELLRKVQEGCVINITKNGREVAVLQDKKQMQNGRAVSAWKELCSIGNEIKGFSLEEIQGFKNDGRKY